MARRKWDEKKFAARKPLSELVGRQVYFTRAPSGSNDWKLGYLHIVDAKTGEIVATVSGLYLKDPATGWDLRLDC